MSDASRRPRPSLFDCMPVFHIFTPAEIRAGDHERATARFERLDRPWLRAQWPVQRFWN